MRRTIKIALIALVAVFATLSVAPTAQAVGTGQQGCTPGYWKNHTDNWQEAAPGDMFASRYTSAAYGAETRTMLESLQGGGGPGLPGAAKILARAATAAWLNAAHDDVGFPWRRVGAGEDGRPGLVGAVNAAFDSGSRSTMLELATRLDNDNNLAECPLD